MQVPLMVELTNRKVLVVGGGKVGFRKATTLADKKALVTCLSPKFCDGFNEREDILCIKKLYQSEDLDGMYLVVAATDDSTLNKGIYDACHEKGILSMTVDVESPSDFSFMATAGTDQLLIAVSTYGGSPVFAKELVAKLLDSVTPVELDQLDQMVCERKKRLKK